MDFATLAHQSLNQLELTRAMVKAFQKDLHIVTDPRVKEHVLSHLEDIHRSLLELNSRLTVPLF